MSAAAFLSRPPNQSVCIFARRDDASRPVVDDESGGRRRVRAAPEQSAELTESRVASTEQRTSASPQPPLPARALPLTTRRGRSGVTGKFAERGGTTVDETLKLFSFFCLTLVVISLLMTSLVTSNVERGVSRKRHLLGRRQ